MTPVASVRTGLMVLALAAASALPMACHTVHQCPILQGLTGGTIPSPLPPPGDTYEVVGRRDGIRFHVVKYNATLYRGGDILNRAGAQALKDLGIKTIISVSPNAQERALAQEFGFVLVEIPFGWFDMTASHLSRFLAAIDANPAPFYVHSFLGINQAGILLAHYRIHREGWTVDTALAEYWRLDGNYWDSTHMVDVLKKNAPAAQP
ncbi:MAG: hypothetical protein IMZ66_03325 [Planctomycetes bacterium]|nr:hypothetical protein [Planctomycetota bacterium]